MYSVCNPISNQWEGLHLGFDREIVLMHCHEIVDSLVLTFSFSSLETTLETVIGN